MPPYLRCPRCFAVPFISIEPVSDSSVSVLTCSSCNAEFASFRGVPVLCSFDHTDVQTVVEMLATRRTLSSGLLDNTERAEPEGVFKQLQQRWAGTVAGQDDPRWMKTRQIELVLVQSMLQGVPLDGALTLDVGAGHGTDSAYYASRGANIVALEPNFGLLASGRRNYGRFAWVGGSADALPIADESMDVVTANASLHHHLNVETSLDEMFRVLKPGGWMITACDSVKASAKQRPLEEDRLHWDVQPPVLSGINEQILRMDVLLHRLMSYGDGVTGEIYLREGDGVFCRMSLSQAADLVQQKPRLWAIMGMRLQKLKSFRTTEHRMRQGKVSTSDLARAILEDGYDNDGYRLLGKLLSAEEIREHAPLGEVNRFLQLNGWRWPLAQPSGQGSPEWRLIYRRGRLFVQPQAATRSVTAVFAIPAVDTEQSTRTSLWINGTLIHQANVIRGQIQHWSFAIPELATDVPCSLVLEIDAAADAHCSEYVTVANHIAVQRLELSNEPPGQCETHGLLPRACLLALKTEGVIKPEITVAVGNLVEAALDALGRLRHQGVHVSIVCDDALWPFYAEQFNGARSTTKAQFATGMAVEDARHAGCTWFLHYGWAQNISVEDTFAGQLAPAVPEAEAKLRRDLDKTRLKLEETKTKLAEVRAKAKAQSSGNQNGQRRSLWSKLFRRSAAK